MSLFALSDLHLALGDPDKPMDIFGGWDDYMVRIEKNWNNLVSDDDTVVVPGDISWAMRLEDSYKDFEFLNSLKGQKVLLKGNHDYWWSTRAKIDRFLLENKFDTLHVVFNDHYNYNDEYAVCGTRGWVYMPGEKNDEKIQAREAARLETSILSALKENKKPVVFLHYPPIFGESFNDNILEILHKYNIDRCYYGHIHGAIGHRNAFQGEFNGTVYRMISSDYLQFFPYKIL